MPVFQVETSPFVFDGPAPPEDVVGRDVEVAALTDRAMHGRFVLLYAPRRYGKTSLIHRIRHEASSTKELTVVLVDLLGVQTLDDISTRMGRSYRDLDEGSFGAKLRRLAARTPELAAEIGFGPAKVGVKRGAVEAPRLLEDLLRLPYDTAEQTGSRVLVVMDEFQAVADVPNAEAIVRSTIQHQRRHVSYLFSGSETSILTTIFGDNTAPLYGQAEQFRLGRLSNEALAPFVEEKFEATGRDVGSALPHLLEEAKGHPQRLAFLAHHLWEATPAAGAADEDVWDAARQVAMGRSRHEFVAIDAGLEAGQRKTARLLAWDEPLYGAAAQRLGLPKGTARKASEALEKRGLAWRPFNEGLELVDPLFAAWLRERNPAP